MWSRLLNLTSRRHIAVLSAATVGLTTATPPVVDGGCSFERAPIYPDSPVDATTVPIIAYEEVKNHATEDSMWVTFRGGVYDVTTFAELHPGGLSRVLMASGGDLKAFWDVYQLHPTRNHILQLLECYRIGTLTPEDAKIAEEESSFGNYYPEDMKKWRYDTLIQPDVITEHPWNSEPSLKHLSDYFYTPNDMFWIRNHNAVPTIEADEYELEISGNHMTDTVLTLEEIKTKLPRYEIAATIQCAGNRQEEFVTDDRPLYVAPHWKHSAIGNAKWAGARVRDVLKYAGLDVDGMSLNETHYKDVKWVSFIGEDADETGVNYGGVLPIEKCIDPFGDCLLAYEMNGQVLPRDHGYPLRLIAPGHAGCRQVKWVSSILVMDQPSSLDSGSKLDRHFAPNVDFTKDIARGESALRLDQAPVIQTLPIQSIICDHRVKEEDGKLFVEMKGVAWSGGGRGIARVEVSVDGGNSFLPSELFSPIKQNFGRNWSWVHFFARVEIGELKHLKNMRTLGLELVCKAVDLDFNCQPEDMEASYNVLGICVNHWHRVPISVCPADYLRSCKK